METALESKFLNAFKFGGVVDGCIDWIKAEYNLPSITFDGINFEAVKPVEAVDGETKKQQAKWQNIHDIKEPQQIEEKTKGFADWFKDRWQALFAEIQENLEGCKTDAEKDRYLESLLTPFIETQGAFSAKADIEQAKAETTLLKRDLPILNDADRKQSQILIAHLYKQADGAAYLAKRYKDIMMEANGKVERCLGYFWGIRQQYTNRLAALLLSYGINLLRLQDVTGAYLTNDIDLTAICNYSPYNGSFKLAQRDFERLHTGGKPQQTETGLYLPVELQKYKEAVDTPKAKICFAVAISKGLIEQTERGYRKCNGISKAQLAYFLQNVYVDARNGGIFPDTALNKLFGETGLKQAANKIADSNTGKPRGAKLVEKILAIAKEQNKG